MGTRLLRQHYDGLSASVDDSLCPPVEPWVRHRTRLVESLGSLTDEQWHAPTRCTEWDVKDVVAHLASADSFWLVSLGNARAGEAPTRFLEGFDPSTSLEPFVDALRTKSNAEMLDDFAAGTDTFVATINEFDDDDWRALAESPFGHLESRFIFTHAFWDSWLHERDIFVPLGAAGPVEDDELLAATMFTCFVGAIEGGLLDDAAPVGDGLDKPIDVSLRFDELDQALHVEVDTGVRIETASPEHTLDAGSAVELVERFGGRLPAVFDTVPDPALAADFQRSAQIL